MNSVKRMLIVTLLLAGVFAVWGQEGLIMELTGTVETKTAGSAVWVPAKRGDRVTGDTVISTGFGSTAVISVGSSTLLVRPLSRLSLEEIRRDAEGEKVTVNLRAGRLRVQVNAPVGTSTDFTVRSPIATASVRGTVFEFDTVNLRVEEGTVAFSGEDGRSTAVRAGGTSAVDESSGRAAAAFETAVADLMPELPAGSDTGAAGIASGTVSEALSGEVELIVDVRW